LIQQPRHHTESEHLTPLWRECKLFFRGREKKTSTDKPPPRPIP
jgi:hypothetical protein